MDTTERDMRAAGFETENGRDWKRGNYQVLHLLGPTQVGPDGFYASLAWRAEFMHPSAGKNHWRSDVSMPTPIAAYAYAEVAQWGGKPEAAAARAQSRTTDGLDQIVRGIELYSDVTPAEIRTGLNALGMSTVDAHNLGTMIFSRCRVPRGGGNRAVELADLMERFAARLHPGRTMQQRFKDAFTG